MKTAIHRAFLTSVLLAFCMGCLLVALPQPAFADSHYPDPDRIFLDGMRYSEGHPAGASYNPSTGVLTLNNYNGGGIYVQHPESFEAETLTIDLKGDNVVTCINAGNDAGIDISGSGSDLIITSAGGER